MEDRLLSVGGMMCENCARHVREALEAIPGVSGVNVDLGAGTVSLSAPGSVGEDEFRSVVDEAGYEFRGLE